MARVPEAALRALSVGTRAIAPAQSLPEFVNRKPEGHGASLLPPPPSPHAPEDISHIARPSAQQPNGSASSLPCKAGSLHAV